MTSIPSSTSSRLAMWLVVLPVVLLAVVLTLFMGLMVYATLNKAELDLIATATRWSATGLIIWLVIGILIYKLADPNH